MGERPVRSNLSRRAGFDLQEHSRSINGLDAINCARPGPFGNPFIVGRDGSREECVDLYAHMLNGYMVLGKTPSVAELRGARSTVAARLEELRGKNLACWCHLDGKPCHADILLELANR